MAEHARMENGTVAEIVDLDPAVRYAWIAAGNPKADVYLRIIDDPKPTYDAAREVLVSGWGMVSSVGIVRTWTVRPKTADELRQVWTALDFLGRFSTAEMAQIETARESDEIVQSFYRAALAAQEVVSDDPRTVAGVNYLSAIGILTLARVNEVLGR
ncbi:MAG: hypothetical protein OEV43_00710 [Coriobacteriia bacterium]|nr:hypothetical protein [Coriobacteriia bacterium]